MSHSQIETTTEISVNATCTFDVPSESDTLIVETGEGKPNANSYISLEEANAYFVGKRLNSTTWTATADETKIVALKMASRVLDHEVQWRGDKAVETSALRWPRCNVYDDDGILLDDASVPLAVREATAEMALWLLAQDRFVERSGIGLKSLRVDVIELVFDKEDKTDLVPMFIRRILTELGSVFSHLGIRTRKLTRV